MNNNSAIKVFVCDAGKWEHRNHIIEKGYLGVPFIAVGMETDYFMKSAFDYKMKIAFEVPPYCKSRESEFFAEYLGAIKEKDQISAAIGEAEIVILVGYLHCLMGFCSAIAQTAKELGALTVGVICDSNGHRYDTEEDGTTGDELAELSKAMDCLIYLPHWGEDDHREEKADTRYMVVKNLLEALVEDGNRIATTAKVQNLASGAGFALTCDEQLPIEEACEAMRWWWSTGLPSRECRLDMVLKKELHSQQEFWCLLEGAQQRDGESKFRFGDYYKDSDPCRALDWYQRSAELGYLPAQTMKKALVASDNWQASNASHLHTTEKLLALPLNWKTVCNELNRGLPSNDLFDEYGSETIEPEYSSNFVTRYNELIPCVAKEWESYPDEVWEAGGHKFFASRPVFDVARYWSTYPHLKMQDGYTLDFQYDGFGRDRYPRLYARPTESARLKTVEELGGLFGDGTTHPDYGRIQALVWEGWRFQVANKMHVTDDKFGFFELSLFCMTANRFCLEWHANYGEYVYFLTPTLLFPTEFGWKEREEDFLGLPFASSYGFSKAKFDELLSLHACPKIAKVGLFRRVSLLAYGPFDWPGLALLNLYYKGKYLVKTQEAILLPENGERHHTFCY